MISKVLKAPEPQRFIEAWTDLSAIRDPDQPGWTRVTFSEPERASREWVRARMQTAGLSTWVDPVGNIVGELKGSNPNAPAIVIGSHTDTVPGGGRFDGVIGVLGAIEVVQMLKESNIELTHPLRVIDFYNEEPNRFGLSCIGSRALTGNLTPDHLALVDDDGQSLAKALADDGRDPNGIVSCRWDSRDVVAFLELHIEQGPVLENEKASIGIVTGIAGIARLKALFEGRRDHAGTTPMDVRRDASCAAAGTMLAVERIAAAGAGTVATVGGIRLTPDATNVVSESAIFTAEMRGPDNAWFGSAQSELESALLDECKKRNVTGWIDWLPPEPPTPMNDGVQSVLVGAVAKLGHEGRRMYSGAGHDAVQMARLAPTGMIFVPSQGGRSHTPEEWTDFEDVLPGIHVLAEAIVRIDEEALI